MGGMTYRPVKVAPWETLADGEWHEVRRGPEGEAKAESGRQFRRHWESLRGWTRINGMHGRLSRIDHGRVIKVQIRPRADLDSMEVLRGKSRTELGLTLIDALHLLNRAVHLRQSGENPPGEPATWAQFDRDAEVFLRKLRGPR